MDHCSTVIKAEFLFVCNYKLSSKLCLRRRGMFLCFTLIYLKAINVNDWRLSFLDLRATLPITRIESLKSRTKISVCRKNNYPDNFGKTFFLFIQSTRNKTPTLIVAGGEPFLGCSFFRIISKFSRKVLLYRLQYKYRKH